MKTSYQAGDAVIVHETAGNRARAEHGEAVSGRAGVIERAMPEADDYEVTLADVGGTVNVTAERLTPAPSAKGKGKYSE